MRASAVHRAMFDAVERKDLDALRALYHRDYIYMSGDGAEQKGAQAGIEVAEKYIKAFPDLSFSIQHQHEPEDGVSIVELRATGTHQGDLDGIPATGKRVEMVGCNVVEVVDDLIIEEREYFDVAVMLQQLGVLD